MDCLAATGSGPEALIAIAGFSLVAIGIALVALTRRSHRRAPAALGIIVLLVALGGGFTVAQPAQAAGMDCPTAQVGPVVAVPAPDPVPVPVPVPAPAGDLTLTTTIAEELIQCGFNGTFASAGPATLTVTVSNVSTTPSNGTPIIVRLASVEFADATITGAGWTLDKTSDPLNYILTSAEVIAAGATATPAVLTLNFLYPDTSSRFFFVDSTLDPASGGDTNPANNTAQASVRAICPT